MNRDIILDKAEQCAARSLATLFPVEDAIKGEKDRPIDCELRLQLALIQQIEALRLTILAGQAPEILVST